MNLRSAIINSLNNYPDFYLADPETLFIEATNRSSEIFSFSEMLDELNKLEKERLAISQRSKGILKWRLTSSGRTWLKES